MFLHGVNGWVLDDSAAGYGGWDLGLILLELLVQDCRNVIHVPSTQGMKFHAYGNKHPKDLRDTAT